MKLPVKHYHYLLHLFDTSTTYDVHEYLRYSSIEIDADHNSSYAGANKLSLLVDPEIYKKYQGYIRTFNNSILSKFNDLSEVLITRVDAKPDLSKFQILRNTIVPIVTPWEEINRDQNILIIQLRTANETIDYQNIGNTSRTLLQKLANIVFNPAKHTTDVVSIELSEGKFKNRLHTYIRCELRGKQNKELRDFAESIIDSAENAIDLSNSLTHDLKANSLLAEFCVISTITSISIVKLIDNHE
jgi:hypothetical protein